MTVHKGAADIDFVRATEHCTPKKLLKMLQEPSAADWVKEKMKPPWAGDTALHVFLMSEHCKTHVVCDVGILLRVIKKLVELHPSALSTRNPRTGQTPLHLAITRNISLDITAFLLHKYPDGAMIKDDEGEVPAFNTIETFDIPTLDLLSTTCPISFMIEKNDGELPLHNCARMEPEIAFLQALVEACPEALRHKDHEGNLPIHCAALNYGDGVHYVRVVCDPYVAGLGVRNNGGETPLMYCIKYASPDHKHNVLMYLVNTFPAACDDEAMRQMFFEVGLKAEEVLELIAITTPSRADAILKMIDLHASPAGKKVRQDMDVILLSLQNEYSTLVQDCKTKAEEDATEISELTKELEEKNKDISALKKTCGDAKDEITRRILQILELVHQMETQKMQKRLLPEIPSDVLKGLARSMSERLTDVSTSNGNHERSHTQILLPYLLNTPEAPKEHLMATIKVLKAELDSAQLDSA